MIQTEGPIIRDQDGQEIVLIWPETPRLVLHAQRLPDGGLAVASCRALRNEPNLFLFDAEGRFRKSFPVGDAIEQFFVDGLGRLWFGYFDEGVISSEPVNAAGIACFDPDGRCIIGAMAANRDWPGIADCYAMSLDAYDRVWMCPYPNFPLGYLEAELYHLVMGAAPTEGAKGILVDEQYIALISSYDRDHSVTLIDRADHSWREIDLFTDNGQPVPLRSISCRADSAVCYDGKALYRFTLADLVNA